NSRETVAAAAKASYPFVLRHTVVSQSQSSAPSDEVTSAETGYHDVDFIKRRSIEGLRCDGYSQQILGPEDCHIPRQRHQRSRDPDGSDRRPQLKIIQMGEPPRNKGRECQRGEPKDYKLRRAGSNCDPVATPGDENRRDDQEPPKRKRSRLERLKTQHQKQ